LIFRDADDNKYFLEAKYVRGEPGDMRWENIYVNPCEMFVRRLF